MSTQQLLKDHPAIKLGHWLRAKRLERGIVKRVFASQIFLSPAEYTELEAGVIRWLGQRQEAAICAALELTHGEEKHFKALVTEAKSAINLSFSNIFTREQLEPIRCRIDGEIGKPDALTREIILNAVFAEIG